MPAGNYHFRLNALINKFRGAHTPNRTPANLVFLTLIAVARYRVGFLFAVELDRCSDGQGA